MRKTVLSICMLTISVALSLPSSAFAAHHSSHKAASSGEAKTASGSTKSGAARAKAAAPSKSSGSAAKASGKSRTRGGKASAEPSERGSKKTARGASRETPKDNTRSAASEAAPRCTSQRVKHGRKTKRVRTCGGEPAVPALKSPIQNVDLDQAPAEGKDGDLKARVAPERAYAVDGQTFFYQGRKYRIDGLTGVDGSEMAKQRLQKELDGGTVSVDATGADDVGGTAAVVRINGRNIADLLSKP